MMTTHAVLGLALGVVGGGAHLALTWWRARCITSGRTTLAWVIYPIGLGAIGLAVFGAAKISPLAAWLAVAGLVLTRLVTLYWVRSAL